jgi:hypothetical protein
MPNKIAGFTLNNSPKTLNSEFYIAQPDGIKENLGGKIFMLVQSDAKRSELIELADFLVSALDKYYYDDEKILLREKLDNLKVENIFEAMLAKLNTELSNFLKDNKNKIDLKTLNLSIGVAYNNEIYFSQLGNNKAFVIYKKEDNFETLKLSQDNDDEDQDVNSKPQLDKLFSNVISGEIPSGSFFVLSNETLSEYISSETFKDIIINLPPLGAAEQIKNKLKEINARVPFSGIIIKNTFGQTESETYIKTEMEASSNLKQTEEKTAKILSTAGLVNKEKLQRRFNKIKAYIKPKLKPKNVLIPKSGEKTKVESLENTEVNEKETIKKESKKEKQKILLKDKIFMKKKPGILSFFKKIGSSIPSINKNSWPSAQKINKSPKLLNFRKKEKFIVSGIAVLIIILVASILFSNYQNRLEEERLAYQEKVSTIEKNQNQVESYLLYGNEKSALELLQETESLIENLPKEKEERQEKYQAFKNTSEELYQELRHVVNVEANTLLNLPNNDQSDTITLVDNNLYLPAKDVDNLYQINTDSNNVNTIELGYDSENLKYPAVDNFNNLYYLSNNEVLQVLLPEQEVNLLDLELPTEGAQITALEGYGTRFYILDSNNSQVYRYNNNTSNLSFNTNWINDTSQLNNPVDMEIDISIYFLEQDGNVSKFSAGEKEDFSIDVIDPQISSAKKLIFTDNFVYILEDDMSRLLQFQFPDTSNERLEFENQYLFNNVDNIDDIIVNNNDLVYILKGSEIYTVDLNSLE